MQRMAPLALVLLSMMALAQDPEKDEEEDARPVAELLAEAEGLRVSGLASARQAVEDRGEGERGLAAHALETLQSACPLYEEVADRGKGAEKNQAEAALTEIYGAMYWTRKLVAELVDAPTSHPAPPDENDPAKEAWKEAVEFEVAHPTDGAEVLLAYKAIVEEFPGTEFSRRARTRILELVDLLPQAEERASADSDPGEDGTPGAQADDVPEPPRLDAATLARRRETMTSRDLALSLARNLNDEDREVRLAAARELLAIHHSSAVGPIVQAFKGEDDPEVQEAIALVLTTTPPITTCLYLKQLARSKKDDELQLRCIALLGRIGTRRAAMAIAEFVIKDQPDQAVMDAGFAAIGTIGNEGGRGYAILAHKLKSLPHVDRAVTAIGSNGDPRLGRYLMPFLSKQYLKKRYGPYMDKKIGSPGVQAMVKLGWRTAPYLLAGLGQPDLRQYSQYVLKQVSGQSYGIGDRALWEAWYKRKKGD